MPPSLASGRIFTYEEAMALFPLVRDRTAQAVGEVEALSSGLADSGETEDPEGDRERFDAAYREIVAAWAAEIESLGCQVKGLWLIDFDSGDGYYCWKHPEPALAHYHGYEEGFAGRVPIT
jgi:hypothetical protein